MTAGERWCRGEPLEKPGHGVLELAIQRLVDVEAREYPLQSDLLVYSQLWQDGAGQPHLAAKGAPEAIAQLCHLEPDSSEALLAGAADLAGQGLRVLAVARVLDGAPLHPHLNGSGMGPQASSPPANERNYLFEPAGLIALADPLRSEVPAAIARAHGAGVRVVMITGDGPQTARAIADQAGLPPGPVLSGTDLKTFSPRELAGQVAQVSVFARVMPQQKLQLVQALQAAGEVMAMGRRVTAEARESADLVLLQDDPSTPFGRRSPASG